MLKSVTIIILLCLILGFCVMKISYRLSLDLVVFSSCWSLLSFPATAADASAVQSGEYPDHVAKTIVVTASRTEKTLDEALSSVEVVTQDILGKEQPTTIAETLLDIPNVDVEASGSPVFSRISIRGSDADQITYLIDGVRQDNYTMSGNRPAFIFVDPEMVRQVEVRRGGGSSLYGNGGIGGTLSVTTKNASDLLVPGQNLGAKVKAGYFDEAKEWSKSAFVYGRQGILDAVVGYSRRDGGVLSTSRTGRRSSTPRDFQYESVIAKLTAQPSGNNQLSLGYSLDKTSQWSGPAGDRADYGLKQHRVTGLWKYRDGDLVDIRANVQYSKMENSFDGRSYNPNAYFSDDYASISGNLQNTSVFQLGGTHILTYGLDLSQNKQKAKDVHGMSDLSRPDSEGVDSGVFIQDEFAVSDRFAIIPVLRFSYYDRKPKGANKDKAGLKDQSDSKLTPGITFTLSPVRNLSFYLSAQSGYRPPFLDELYTSMEYLDFNISSVVLPNPNLKPEESLNLELGANGNFGDVLMADDRFVVKANIFHDKVKNLIDAGFTGDSEITPDGNTIMYYTVKNIGEALKTGFELTADYYTGNFDFRASYGQLRAKNETTGEILPGVTPQQATFRAGYTHRPWNLNGWYRLRMYQGGKSRREVGYNSGVYENWGGFATHAVGFEWKPKIKNATDFTVGFSVDNLTNKKYRYLNGGYGHARSCRAWLSAAF